MNKYHRQEILKGFGSEGQQKLMKAAALIVGVGGLGCPAAQYLVAMGIGRLGIIDGDDVSLTNLHRQILFTPDDIGRKKVEVAKERLTVLNPDVEIVAYPHFIDQAICIDLLPKYDIIIDCSDNFTTRYMLNDACVILNKPLAFAAVSRYEGQVALFNLSHEGRTSGNYRDLYPEMPSSKEVLNCAEAGILGVMAGIIGVLQAIEVVKYLTQTGTSLVNKMLYYNMLDHHTMIIEYRANAETRNLIPASIETFMINTYEEFCADIDVQEITFQDYSVADKNEFSIVDIRGESELPKWTLTDYKAIELKDLHLRIDELPQGKILFICQAGVRSVEAARIATNHFKDNSRFYSLKGGLLKINNN
jgi:sulfur-carrier protein adenylyltransferase/sulfurtransferase